jgi:hypothetical protein
MAATNSITDCHRLVAAVQEASGVVPDTLQVLLSTADMLMTPAAAQDPLGPILDAALARKLDAKKLDAMLADAATVDAVNGYKASLRQRAEHAVVGRFHKALRDGAADAVLDSMRPAFDAAAEQIAVARSLISAESDLEHVVESGEPGTIEAWQQLRGHIQVVSRIALVAMQFGCQLTAQFPQVQLYTQAENFRINDQALMCCSGGLTGDSAWFGRPWRRPPDKSLLPCRRPEVVDYRAGAAALRRILCHRARSDPP